MNDVTQAPRWYWNSEKEVVVRCQFILCSDLELHPHCIQNDLPRLNTNYCAIVLSNNQMKESNEDHDTLMDAASLWEGLDYAEELPEDCFKCSDYDTDDSNSESDEE